MIKHIVMWKLKDSHEGMSRDELVTRSRRAEGLKEAIPEIKTMELGRNFNELPVSYDVALYSEFESKGASRDLPEAPRARQGGAVHPPDKDRRGPGGLRNVGFSPGRGVRGDVEGRNPVVLVHVMPQGRYHGGVVGAQRRRGHEDAYSLARYSFFAEPPQP